MAYQVEFKALKTGEWYTKGTYPLNVARSVALCNNNGRAYRITDTETDSVIEEEEAKATYEELYG